MKSKQRNSNDEVYGSYLSTSQRVRQPKATARLHEFYISGQITDPEDYIEDFDIIRHAGPADTVKLYINSGGGNMDTAIQYMRVIGETEATVIASIEGYCCSAATMIFLCADEYELTPFSLFMVHNYSGGAYGKGHEMYGRLAFEKVWSAALLKEIYSEFLSEAEINDVLEGKDLWFDMEEVAERMEKRNKAIRAAVELEQATRPD